MDKMGSESKVSDQMVKRLASKLYHAERRRNITAVAAIVLSSMLIILSFSTIMSIETAMRRSQQMLIGTQAEGIYMNISYNWFEELRDRGYFDKISIVLYMGHYETASSTGDKNRIFFTDEETASWNFNELLEGRWPEADGEIVVDERFVQEHGGEIEVGDTMPILLKTADNEIRQDVVICGICACNDELDEARMYVSEAFEKKDKSVFAMYAFCRFEKDRYTDEDLKNFLLEINPHADIIALVNPAAGNRPGTGYIVLIGGLIMLSVICAGLMIYTIYYISTVKNVVQYGQLKLIGVTGKQIKAIIRQHALRQFLAGVPIGCLLGVVFGYVLMPVASFYMGIRGGCEFKVKPGYFLCAAVLSYVVVYIGVRKPMRILAKTPPIHAAGFTDSRRENIGKVRNARFTPGRFARRNIKRRGKNTALVAFSMSIVILLFVTTTNMVHSLNLDALLSMINLFADIEIASEDYLYGLDAGEAGGNYPIPNSLREELEKITQNVETVYHYQLLMPLFLDGEDAENYCRAVVDNERYLKSIAEDEGLYDIMVGRALTYRETGKPVVMQESYRFYEYSQIAGVEVFEGSLDQEKFESGEYVLAVALDGEGSSLYHAGDVVELYDEFPEEEAYSYEQDENGKFPYFESLRKKKYTVMAVVGDTYRNQMAWGDENTTGLAYILPAQMMEHLHRMPDLFLVTINVPDAEMLKQVETDVRECLKKMNGEGEVSYRSKGVYREGLDRLGMIVSLFGNGLAVIVGMMALVNFINSSVSGIAERKEEFSTLQAIGMMKRLLLKVLRLENLYTILLAVIPGYLLGQSVSVVMIHKVSERIPYLKCDVTLPPGILLSVLIVMLSMLYPNRRTDIGDRKRVYR